MANPNWNNPYPKMPDKEVDMVNSHINGGNNFWNDHIQDDETGMLTTAGSMGMIGTTAEFTYRIFNYLRIEMGIVVPITIRFTPYNVTNDRDANDERSLYSMGGWDHCGHININIPAIYSVTNMLTESDNLRYNDFLRILRATIVSTLIHEFSHVRQYDPVPDSTGRIPQEYEKQNLAHCACYWYPILRDRIISVFNVDIYESIEVTRAYHFNQMSATELYVVNAQYREEDAVRTVGAIFGYAFYSDDQNMFKYFMSFFEFYKSLMVSIRFVDPLANFKEYSTDFGYIREKGIPQVENINKLIQFIDLLYPRIDSIKIKVLNKDEIKNSTERAVLEIDMILSYYCPFTFDEQREKIVAKEINDQSAILYKELKKRGRINNETR